jgi:anti-anti-sigma factor
METFEYRERDIIILQLQGKLDSFTSKGFQEKLLGLIEQGESKIVIDGALLEYISSAGIKIFYLASNRLQEANGKMVFCGLNKRIQRVFDIVEMSSEFLIFPTREQALKAF